ncbi:putative acetyltransferase [Smittium culicis]|uniref:Putative acetyltransferase n=1 Tax=Smittium culicis TaxID=133412 RepID=A0A1R1Y3R2_9FUNG|nr:putative acetyltransferase [Smittium culicis]
MISGDLFHGGAPELDSLRLKAIVLIHQMQSSYNDKEERVRLTKELLGTCGETNYLELYAYFDYDCGRVDIGNDVIFGPNVQIYTISHPLESHKSVSVLGFPRPIKIGDNVWIGGGAIILPGITIGNNSVVAAGSIVTKDVPENVVVAGNPAKFMKKINN